MSALSFTRQLLANNASAAAIVRVVNQLQQQLETIFASTSTAPVPIRGIALVAGRANMVPTGLTSRLVGWTLIRVRSEAIVWDSQDSNTNAAYLALWCSADVTVDIEVF